MAKLAALVPKPRVNLTRLFGVIAPNNQYIMTITQEKKAKPKTTEDKGDKTAKGKRHSMTWAKRLQRVFNIDTETCRACQRQVKVIACIEDPDVIKKILVHLKSNEKKHPASVLKQGHRQFRYLHWLISKRKNNKTRLMLLLR